jgi:hypothetical protein
VHKSDIDCMSTLVKLNDVTKRVSVRVYVQKTVLYVAVLALLVPEGMETKT